MVYDGGTAPESSSNSYIASSRGKGTPTEQRSSALYPGPPLNDEESSLPLLLSI